MDTVMMAYCHQFYEQLDKPYGTIPFPALFQSWVEITWIYVTYSERSKNMPLFHKTTQEYIRSQTIDQCMHNQCTL